MEASKPPGGSSTDVGGRPWGSDLGEAVKMECSVDMVQMGLISSNDRVCWWSAEGQARKGQDHGGCPGCRLEWTMCFQGNENFKVIQTQLLSNIGEEGFALSNLKNGVCSGSWKVFSGRKGGRLNEHKWFGGQGGGGQS